jgi:hypothetical protein
MNSLDFDPMAKIIELLSPFDIDPAVKIILMSSSLKRIQ